MKSKISDMKLAVKIFSTISQEKLSQFMSALFLHNKYGCVSAVNSSDYLYDFKNRNYKNEIHKNLYL